MKKEKRKLIAPPTITTFFLLACLYCILIHGEGARTLFKVNENDSATPIIQPKKPI